VKFALVLVAFAVLTLAGCETPLPAKDAGPVMISLERTPCFGRCPIYTVSLDGDGSVTYNGQRFVGVTGERHAKISRADVDALLRAFDAAHFESLDDAYRAHVTDLPSTIVTLTRNGHTKRVVDYAGTSVGMPQAVRDIEQQIDRAANTAQWVHGATDPIEH